MRTGRRRTRLDALTLEETPLRLADMPSEEVKAVLLRGLRENGPARLPWTDELRQRQARILLLRRVFPEEGWPDAGDTAAFSPHWRNRKTGFLPFWTGLTRLAQLTAGQTGTAFAALLPWPLERRLRNLLPGRADRAFRLIQ